MENRDKKAGFIKAAAKYAVPAALSASFLFSIAMMIFEPVPHGHRYDLCLKLTLGLLLFWLIYKVIPGLIFRKGLLIVIAVFGIGIGIREYTTLDPNREIVGHYASVFETMEKGLNPYTSGTTFHLAEFLRPVYGNFNYPPMEIYPYYIAYRLAGRWSSGVLTWAFIIIQVLACVIYALTFRTMKLRYMGPFFIVFVFMEFHINPAMTIFVTALIIWAIKKDREQPAKGYHYLVAFLLGVGLMTKFLIIPLAAGYYAYRLGSKEPRKFGRTAIDAAITVATALAIMAPYGVVPVFKNTILFNVVLKDRAVMTTFFPNVLSGLMSWINRADLYPLIAVIILAGSVYAASRLNVFSAMLTPVFTFLLVAPTPRTQYLPTALYIIAAGITIMFGERGAIPPKLFRKAPLPVPAPDSKPAESPAA